MKKKLWFSLSLTAISGLVWGGWRVYSALGDSLGSAAVKASSAIVSSAEIEALNKDIEARKSSIERLRSKQEEYKRLIQEKQAQRADLEDQLAIFDNRIAALEASIEDVQLNIDKTQLEIRKIDLEISLKLKEIDRQKEQIASALGLLYKEGDKSELEVILLNDSLSEYIDQLKHIRDLNSSLADKLETLQATRDSLEEDRRQTAIKKLSLEKLSSELSDKMAALGGEREAKSIVLDETRQSEGEYQRLLSQAKKEQQNAAWDIANMEKTVRMKLAQSEEFKNLQNSSKGFIWPVPKNTITAYFHDPDYPYRNVMEHPAVDVRAKQGTPIKAAAAGYVARVKPGPDGSYGYVMIVHADGLSTVYGHVSRIYVEEEQYVSQGQLIAASGGAPGTPGAGKMTTGSHLHFETRLNGIPVNPLDYLP